MSNTQVGAIFDNIIGDVIESSRVDFEEGGVDDHVLEELRKGWQQKLSQLQVAQFPWDPKPDPQVVANPPTVPSNATYQSMGTPPISQPQGGLTVPQASNSANPGPRIKSEPGLEDAHGMMPQPHSQQSQQQYSMPLTLPQHAAAPPNTAQQRAVQNLQSHYGSRAAASINSIHNGASAQQQAQGQGQNGQQQQSPQMQQQHQHNMRIQHMQQMQQMQRAQGQTMPPHPQHQQQQQGSQMSQEQYRQAMAAQTARAQLQAQQQQQQKPSMNGQNGVAGAQTDGAGDEEESYAVIKQFNAGSSGVALGRVEIDGLIRSKIETMGSTMEGGGLMLALKKASTAGTRQRKVKKTAGMEQTDGPDDEVKEELDEDAINSDLDDPDDGLNEDDEDDEGMGHIMLCMYDKVQRVKNKWKCVMKDGVLTVNNKEYVFHKASGEYEW